MKRAEARRRIRQLARTLTNVPGRTQEHQAIRGFLLGVVYSLDTAITLGFKARSYSGYSAAYGAELTRLSKKLAVGSGVTRGTWLAGFFFNSSLQHLAGSYHRLLKLVTNKNHAVVPCLVDLGVAQGRFTNADVEALDQVHRDVNDLKHRDEGLLKRRRVPDPSIGIRAAEQAVELFKKIAETG